HPTSPLFPYTTLFRSTQRASAQAATSSVSYSIADRGAISVETVGGADAMLVGYGRVQPAVTTPAGVAIFGLRQNGVLVTETGVRSEEHTSELQSPCNL